MIKCMKNHSGAELGQDSREVYSPHRAGDDKITQGFPFGKKFLRKIASKVL